MTEQPLGDAMIQITYLSCGEETDLWSPDALFTVRAKDQDLTAEQLEAVSDSCLAVAAAIRADEGRHGR